MGLSHCVGVASVPWGILKQCDFTAVDSSVPVQQVGKQGKEDNGKTFFLDGPGVLPAERTMLCPFCSAINILGLMFCFRSRNYPLCC